MTSMLIDGVEPAHAAQAAAIADRAYQYGDGLFETMRLQNGAVRFLDAHLERLLLGCERLKIDPPDVRRPSRPRKPR